MKIYVSNNFYLFFFIRNLKKLQSPTEVLALTPGTSTKITKILKNIYDSAGMQIPVEIEKDEIGEKNKMKSKSEKYTV